MAASAIAASTSRSLAHGSEETTSPVVGLTETACVADKFIIILSRCLRSVRILAYLSIH
ncbi:hypothetical protein BN426_2156 [Klebsiella pneumoniae subsp. pneumoniae ST258-K26BO]|nr:hypothetical protein BN426_2156 [Klebsiella pneumoniae subsp. pneumoniae ST258-K26BO]